MGKKLKDARGETLIETLASILIGALSVALLFAAVMASVHMGRTTKAVDEAFYENFSKAEQQSGSGESVPNNKITVRNGTITEQIPVTFYGGGSVWSYALP